MATIWPWSNKYRIIHPCSGIVNGDWPSGKAVDSGSTIGGSNPSSPAMKIDSSFDGSFFIFEVWTQTPNETIGVKNASGILQGKLLFKTCFERCSLGPAEGRANPSSPAILKCSPAGGLFSISGLDSNIRKRSG